jgi:phosphate transport system substrate-binding protein
MLSRKGVGTVLAAITAVAVLVTGCGAAVTPAGVATQAAGATTQSGASAATAKPQAGSITINGAGATFPLPVYTEWVFAYQYVDPSVVINYQGIGSGGGQKGILDKTLDFAGSDSLLKDEQYAQDKTLQMLPMLAGAVVPVYNLVDKAGKAITTTVVLDGQTLVDIYMANIKKWNDPKIAALNPTIADRLPDAQITVVHRSDGSGTTEIWTKYLAAVSSDWKTKVGAANAVEWPVDKAGNGVGGKGNPGVAAAVQVTAGSIGYVELSYAIQNSIPYASLVNAAGKTVKADAKSLASAVSDFSSAFSDRLTADIVNGKSEGAWPIAGYTYIILRMEQTDLTKATRSSSS